MGAQPRDYGLWEEGERNNGGQDDEEYDVSGDEMRDWPEGLRDVGKSDRWSGCEDPR